MASILQVDSSSFTDAEAKDYADADWAIKDYVSAHITVLVILFHVFTRHYFQMNVERSNDSLKNDSWVQYSSC